MYIWRVLTRVKCTLATFTRAVLFLPHRFYQKFSCDCLVGEGLEEPADESVGGAGDDSAEGGAGKYEAFAAMLAVTVHGSDLLEERTCG